MHMWAVLVLCKCTGNPVTHICAMRKKGFRRPLLRDFTITDNHSFGNVRCVFFFFHVFFRFNAWEVWLFEQRYREGLYWSMIHWLGFRLIECVQFKDIFFMWCLVMFELFAGLSCALGIRWDMFQEIGDKLGWFGPKLLCQGQLYFIKCC